MLHLLLSTGATLAPELDRYAHEELISLSAEPARPPYSDIGFDLLSGRDVSTLMVLLQASDRLAEVA